MDSALVPSVSFGRARDLSVQRRNDDASWLHQPHVAGNSTPHTMAAPRRLPKHLHNVLGADAGGDLVTILDEIRADNDRTRAELSELRLEMRKGFEGMALRFERVDLRFAALEMKIADVKADLMKWSFAFWIGAVVAIAVLAKLVR
jgi:hypothetical protein